MGLDMSHGAWHGAYSAFNRYRDKVAEAAGYPLVDVDVYGVKYRVPDIDWSAIPDGAIVGDWHGVNPDDALLYLFAHSDCEGHLKPKACRRLADRLEELLPAINALPNEEFGHIGDYGVKTQQLIRGLRKAAKAGKRLEFF